MKWWSCNRCLVTSVRQVGVVSPPATPADSPFIIKKKHKSND